MRVEGVADAPFDNEVTERHPQISDDIPVCKPCTTCKMWQPADVREPSHRRTPKPRSWIADPVEQKSFGKAKRLSWKVAPERTYESSLIRAAHMQHQIAFHVRFVRGVHIAAGREGYLFTQLADRLHSVDYYGLMRLLRGDVPMGLHHAAELGTLFDFDLSTPWDKPITDTRGATGRRLATR